MTRRADASLVALALTNRLLPAEHKPLTARDFWPVLEQVDDLGLLLDGADAPVAGIDPERISGLLGAATALAFELERLETAGLWVLSAVDDGYPPRFRTRLGDAAPPVLIGAGPTELLDGGGLGIVGSRDVTAEGGEVARDAARAAVGRGRPVISGGARGVDQLSMGAALDADGSVVGLLADGVDRQLREPEVRRAIHEGRACYCSPYKPDAEFSAGNAMGRNKLIYALADVTLVVAADEGSGGTWAGATEALERGFGRVAVWRGEGEGPGNAALVDRGAVPVTDPSQLFEPPPEDERAPTPDRSEPAEQMRLDLSAS